MKILEDKIRELVFRTMEEFNVPKSAGQGIVFCIMSQWHNHGHFRWFEVSFHRAWLLTDPNLAATTRCLKKCLETIERYQQNYFESPKRTTLQSDDIKKDHDEHISRITDTSEQI